MNLSKDDVFKIIKIIEESGYDDVRLEVGDFKVHVQRQAAGIQAVEPAAAPREALARPAEKSAPHAPAPAAPARPSASVDGEPLPEGAVVVRAPMLGTFYRSPAPGEKPFVEVGTKVKPDDTICLVEVMKLFNSVPAGTAGTVAAIVADDAAVVEAGQVLFWIEPGPGA